MPSPTGVVERTSDPFPSSGYGGTVTRANQELIDHSRQHHPNHLAALEMRNSAVPQQLDGLSQPGETHPNSANPFYRLASLSNLTHAHTMTHSRVGSVDSSYRQIPSQNLALSQTRLSGRYPDTLNLDPRSLPHPPQLQAPPHPDLLAHLALELSMEKLRVNETTKARDVALSRLGEAYACIREKNRRIALLERSGQVNINGLGVRVSSPGRLAGLDVVESHDDRRAHWVEEEGLNIPSLGREEADVRSMQTHIQMLEKTLEDLELIDQRCLSQSLYGVIGAAGVESGRIPMNSLHPDPPPYEMFKGSGVDVCIQTEVDQDDGTVDIADVIEGRKNYIPPKTDAPTLLLAARNALLSQIPLSPECAPDDTLRAIVIPSPFTLHEFLNGIPNGLRNLLGNYRILPGPTTYWCPDREEHGYMYVPLFKCSTNPRIATAHRWNSGDVLGRMGQPTECFYNKDGTWYYAGRYRAFKLDELDPKEWAVLSNDTTTAIIKETLSGRKNSSPQNTYETSQLYAVGALRVACVGLQCVGFSRAIYEGLMKHSQSWKGKMVMGGGLPVQSPGSSTLGVGGYRGMGMVTAPASPSTPLLSPGPGLSPGSSVWNSSSPGTPWSVVSAGGATSADKGSVSGKGRERENVDPLVLSR